MYSDVSIPKLPASVQFAEIANIHVSLGQQVSEGQILFDVETEKVVLEVEAFQNGIVNEISVSNGDHVSSEQVVMRLEVSEIVESSSQSRVIEDVEAVTEKLVKNEVSPALPEDVTLNILFDKRGVIFGVTGLIVGLFIGALGTVILLG